MSVPHGRHQRHQEREPPILAGRVPPSDLKAEAAVLSAAIGNQEAADTVLQILEANDFYSDNHRIVFGAIKAIVDQSRPLDVVTIANQLRATELIVRAGGAKYLGELTDATPSVANVAEHARLVADKSRLRKLIAKCQKISGEAYGGVEDIDAYISQAEGEVSDLVTTTKNSDPEDLKPVLNRTFTKLQAAAERGDGITGHPSGYTDVDKKTAGLHPGDLLIVAARPGMGKTSYVLNVAANVASPTNSEGVVRPGVGVAIFSLEMPKEQCAQRMVCAEGRVDVGKLRSGHLYADDWTALTEAARHLASLPIKIDDTPGIGLHELKSKCRRIRSEFGDDPGLGLIVIDYLQLMGGRSVRGQSREQEISEISRGLKQLAKELDVPVIALSQLNRSVETRGGKDKRPMLSDLRESGAIEQDADTIIFIYRDEYYNKEDTRARGIAELIIAKQRNGPTGTVRARWIAACTRFENLAPGEYEGFEDYE